MDSHGRVGWHQPDGLRLDINAGTISVYEFKFRHCEAAYPQILRYVSVLELLFPDFTLSALEVVRWYEPGVRWPKGGGLISGLQATWPPSVSILRL